MSTTSAHPTAKDLILRLLETINTGAWDQLDEFVDEDVIVDWPQSRERIVGRRNLQHLMQNYPGQIRPNASAIQFVEGDDRTYMLTPMFTMVKSEGAGDTATSSVKSRYPDGTDWYIINLAKAREGKLVKLVQYFAPVYDAPEWRAPWVQRLEE